MKPSPLQFARDFEKLKSDLSRLPAADLRLLLLVRFWEQLAPVAGESAYESYLNDYRSLVIGLVQADALSDLTIDSLNRVRRVLDDLVAASGTEAAPELRTATSTVTLRLATLYFYVGALDEALSLGARLEGVDDLALPADSEIRGLSPLDTLRTIYDKYRQDYPELGTLLQGILAKWEEDALAVEHDRVWCLFVDKDGKGNAATGRMRLLRGTVEQVGRVAHHSYRVAHHSWWVMQSHPKGRATNDTEAAGKRPGSVDSPDQVAFDNQVKTADDPFIGAAYDSLKAVRTGLRCAGFAQRAQGSYRAFLSIDGSNRTFTGDSIGLAVSLVAFTQLLKPEVMRQERFIASDIAVTGSITADGRITPVNNDSIGTKIERAFFSHVRYVVLPEANLATARDTVKHLSKQHPKRKLRLVSAAHLDDVLNDRNIIRSEKVCLSAFIGKKAARYTRAIKVQVPLLLLLLYALTCLIYPKAWVGFDWNPQYVRLTERGFEALNKDSVRVWDVDYECDSLSSSKCVVEDLDGDGKNEVAFIPDAVSYCPEGARLHVYDYQGALMFQCTCAIQGVLAVDSVADMRYTAGALHVTRIGGQPIMVTEVYQELPARSHIRLWDARGKQLGWYINRGYTVFQRALDWDGDGREELFFGGINNGMECASMFVLRPDSSMGVSPSDAVWESNTNRVKRGNQKHYVLFPPSDLSRACGQPYNSHRAIVEESDGVLRVDIKESGKPSHIIYRFDKKLRLLGAHPDDLFMVQHRDFVAEELLPTMSSHYWTRIRDSVTYWTDSGWVTEGELRAVEKKTK